MKKLLMILVLGLILVGNAYSETKFSEIKKTLALKHGQIIATISQVSMFHMFLYIIAISLKHLQKVFGTRPRERKNMLISRRHYTSPVSCREIPDSGDRAKEL